MIQTWAAAGGHSLSCTRFWAADKLPEPDLLDMLIVMGGPMGVNDEGAYPWLVQEKNFIRQTVEKNKMVLGICLGAQLLASVCGASVYPHHDKEIGWFPVTRQSGTPGWLDKIFPQQFTMFHWHGDTFDIPESAALLGSSSACRNQGFVLGDRIIALQFHPEMTSTGIAALVDNCRRELVNSNWVQTERQIAAGCHYLAASNEIMKKLLDHCAHCARGC